MHSASHASPTTPVDHPDHTVEHPVGYPVAMTTWSHTEATAARSSTFSPEETVVEVTYPTPVSTMDYADELMTSSSKPLSSSGSTVAEYPSASVTSATTDYESTQQLKPIPQLFQLHESLNTSTDAEFQQQDVYRLDMLHDQQAKFTVAGPYSCFLATTGVSFRTVENATSKANTTTVVVLTLTKNPQLLNLFGPNYSRMSIGDELYKVDGLPLEEWFMKRNLTRPTNSSSHTTTNDAGSRHDALSYLYAAGGGLSLLPEMDTDTNSVVLDVRGNPGGLYYFASLIPQLFAADVAPMNVRYQINPSTQRLFVDGSDPQDPLHMAWSSTLPGKSLHRPFELLSSKQVNTIGQAAAAVLAKANLTGVTALDSLGIYNRFNIPTLQLLDLLSNGTEDSQLDRMLAIWKRLHLHADKPNILAPNGGVLAVSYLNETSEHMNQTSKHLNQTSEHMNQTSKHLNQTSEHEPD
ncbi:hypothetical protein BSLG_001936 [Batrachochytrium salamandrivorans]|nr:hypothetical protein BSLG_001936 [Batrachochytrium salamandrivorans]